MVPPRWIALLQAREQLQDLVQLLLVVALVGEETAHGQVFLDGQAGEHAAAFRHHRDALAHDVRGRLADQLFTQVLDAAAVRLRRAAQGHQQVDLPAPLAPIRVTISPWLISTLTLCSAWILP
jgi:hypothetical protein